MAKSIYWIRNDFRLSDNPALTHAAAKGELIPVYILDDETPQKWKMGGASRWWLHYSILSLAEDYKKHGVNLILRKGNPLTILNSLIKETNAVSVFWNRCYEPFSIKRDTEIKKQLEAASIEVKSFNGSLLFEPWEVKNKQGSNFKVFTPFWKHCLSIAKHDVPLKIPQMQKSSMNITSDDIASYKLLPTKPNWATGIAESWNVSENEAFSLLDLFLGENINNYSNGRDIPAQNSTSKLSPYLHFGQISPRQIWHSAHFRAEIDIDAKGRQNLSKFMAELGWREFAYNLLYHYPEFDRAPFNEKFTSFPWEDNAKMLEKWQKGQTGYPIVDAGMRQLWQTGYMHNRVRMIVASFLTKHLLISWQRGAEWFWDTLVDADLANNTAGWQWVAGCGADAAPYFRIFNPVLQGEKFDSNSDYVRKWVPELSSLENKYIHCPWKSPVTVKNYPFPIIDHDNARKRAMAAYNVIK